MFVCTLVQSCSVQVSLRGQCDKTFDKKPNLAIITICDKTLFANDPNT